MSPQPVEGEKEGEKEEKGADFKEFDAVTSSGTLQHVRTYVCVMVLYMCVYLHVNYTKIFSCGVPATRKIQSSSILT